MNNLAVRQAVEEFASTCREWKKNKEPPPSYWGPRLNDADLSGLDLRGINLFSTKMHDVNFAGTDLTNAILCCTVLHHANFTDAILRDVNFIGASLYRTNFTRADLRRAEFADESFSKQIYDGANMSGVRMEEVNYKGTISNSAFGYAGGKSWFAFYLLKQGVMLSWNRDLYRLEQWLTLTPSWMRVYGKSPEDWYTGPAVAIQEAQKLTKYRGSKQQTNQLQPP
jgi:hypothetical protein